MKKICRTCKYRSDAFTSVCVNPESKHVADFVMPDNTCEMWLAERDVPNDKTGESPDRSKVLHQISANRRM